MDKKIIISAAVLLLAITIGIFIYGNSNKTVTVYPTSLEHTQCVLASDFDAATDKSKVVEKSWVGNDLKIVTIQPIPDLVINAEGYQVGYNGAYQKLSSNELRLFWSYDQDPNFVSPKKCGKKLTYTIRNLDKKDYKISFFEGKWN